MRSKVKKVSCRMLSVLLSFLMVFYLIPTTIFADLFYSDDWESVTVNDAVGDLVMVTPAKYNATSNSASSVANSAEVNYTYDTATRRLNVIQTESTAYYFTYDCFGNTTSVTVGSGSGASTLASYTYLANNGKLDTLTYGNGLQEKYYYDNLDRVSEIWYNTGEGGALELRYSYVYNANGALHTVTDHKNDTQTLYRYDGAGKLIASYELNSNEIVYSDSFVYTDDEKLAQYNSWLSYKTNTGYYREYAFDAYGYNSNRQISTYRIVSDNLDSDIAFTYDNMLRVSGETLTWGDQNGAIYQQQTVYDYYGKTPQLNGITVNLYGGDGETQISSKTYRYTYDQNGNITEIKDANNVIQNKYYYDDLGQLIREDNRALNKTYTYEYDDAGNMLYKRQCAFTLAETLPSMSIDFDMSYKTYGGWGDQMDMDNIFYYGYSYDKSGNLVEVYYPEEYFLFTWEGRQLTSAKWYYDDYSYSTPIRFNYYDVQYTYNEGGIRTSKTVDGIKHEYVLNGSQIVAETWTQNGIEYMLRYVYDESGSPIGMKYRTSQQAAEYYTLYFFEKNAFGDIIGIYNSGGELLGTYTYDAWGNCVVSGTDSILNMNPFRYRGYYYDTETGFYYLQSRYYNPAWGRFLNADSYVTTGQGLLSYNMYAYCNNNPVMFVDPLGQSWQEFQEAWLDFTEEAGVFLPTCGMPC